MYLKVTLIIRNFIVSGMEDDIFSTLEPSQSEYTPYEERPETYIVPIIFFIIFVVGVLGNGTLVIIFLRHRAMRNVPNT